MENFNQVCDKLINLSKLYDIGNFTFRVKNRTVITVSLKDNYGWDYSILYCKYLKAYRVYVSKANDSTLHCSMLFSSFIELLIELGLYEDYKDKYKDIINI